MILLLAENWSVESARHAPTNDSAGLSLFFSREVIKIFLIVIHHWHCWKFSNNTHSRKNPLLLQFNHALRYHFVVVAMFFLCRRYVTGYSRHWTRTHKTVTILSLLSDRLWQRVRKMTITRIVSIHVTAHTSQFFPPTNQPNNRTTEQPNNHTTTQPHNHTTTQPHNHTTTQPHNHTTKQPNNQTNTHTHNRTQPNPTQPSPPNNLQHLLVLKVLGLVGLPGLLGVLGTVGCGRGIWILLLLRRGVGSSRLYCSALGPLQSVHHAEIFGVWFFYCKLRLLCMLEWIILMLLGMLQAWWATEWWRTCFILLRLCLKRGGLADKCYEGERPRHGWYGRCGAGQSIG